jgi:hypothetical protein
MACGSTRVLPETACTILECEFRRKMDIDLSRSALAGMVGQIAGLVQPLIDASSRFDIAGERVHSGDTEVPLL